jgi:hypothetical protein
MCMCVHVRVGVCVTFKDSTICCARKHYWDITGNHFVCVHVRTYMSECAYVCTQVCVHVHHEVDVNK